MRNACRDVFHCLSVDFHSSTAEVQAEWIDIICSMIYRRIHSTGTDTAMAQSDNDEGSIENVFFVYILEGQVEKLCDSIIHLSSMVAATEACILLSAVLLIGRSAITSSIQPNPCSNSHSNDITNIIRVESAGLVDRSPILQCAILLG